MVTYTKLKNGSWGIRATSSVAPGQSVDVAKKDGTTKTETVRAVLWSGNGIWICSIGPSQSSSSSSPRRSSSSNHSGRCRECRGPLVSTSYHRAMEGYCGSCAFDEFDC
jgi:hypothetical protein